MNRRFFLSIPALTAVGSVLGASKTATNIPSLAIEKQRTNLHIYSEGDILIEGKNLLC